MNQRDPRAPTAPDSTTSLLRTEVDTALAEVAAAEHALYEVLDALGAGVRAEKVRATEAVEAAFVRLRQSRSALTTARRLLDQDAGPGEVRR